MDRIFKVCRVLAIFYYLLLISGIVCQATQSQNGSDIDLLIQEIFNIPTSDRGSNPTDSDSQNPVTHDINTAPPQPQPQQPDQYQPPAQPQTPVLVEPPQRQPERPVHQPEPAQPLPQYPSKPTPTEVPTSPYPKPKPETPTSANTINEPNVSELLIICRKFNVI